MRYFSMRGMGLVALSFCVGALVLTGCGRKEKAPVSGAAVDEKRVRAKLKKGVRVPSTKPITEERTYYDFEGNIGGWEVPMWAQGKADHVAKDILVSKEVASKGNASMKVATNFPGGIWAAALVEIQQYLDISNYRVIRADLYLPKDAPIGLKSKIILTVGNNWKFVEMSGSVPLVPGEWATISANIEPGSYDWKRVVPDEEFAEDIRKIAIRIESNRKPSYSGPLYIDNVRVGR